MSEPHADPLEELHELTRALRAHAECLAATGASGLEVAPRHGVGEEPRAAPAAGMEAVQGSSESAPRAVPSPAARALPAQAPRAARAEVTVEKPVASERQPALAPDEKHRRLDVLAETVRGCTLCALCKGRTQTVFARGTGAAGLCFVGEGPGAEEDAQGLPFVGKAGMLLDRMIEAMGFSRDEVYVANVVKCRPPDNRKPEPEEMSACLPYLREQLEVLAPEVIVALGATAVQGLFGTSEGITRLRGRWRLYRGAVPVMPTFHPAYLLRNPAAKKEVWEDLQAVLRQMGRATPSRR